MEQKQITETMVSFINENITSMTRKDIGKEIGLSGGMVTKIYKDPGYFLTRGTRYERARVRNAFRSTAAENGSCCSSCTVHYITPHGYPVICEHCMNHKKVLKSLKKLPLATIQEC